VSGIPTVTVPQPIPTLAALGVVTALTMARHAPADVVGGRLLIHASQYDAPISDMHRPENKPGWDKLGDLIGGAAPPLGRIVASATLTACVSILDDATSCGLLCREDHIAQADGELWVQRFSHVEDCIPHWDAHEISDQLPYGDWSPGRWAWLLDNVKSTTERCPACWGTGEIDYLEQLSEFIVRPDVAGCWLCRTTGKCPPVPARGRPGVWRWQP
jgi:hypothetical protein